MNSISWIINTDKNKTQIVLREAIEFFKLKRKDGMANCVDEYFFRLALDETLTNAIIHGNMGVNDRIIHVNIIVNEQHVEITVCDEGAGFNPFSIPDPREKVNIMRRGGRGLHILKTVGNVIWDDDRGCVTVTL